MTRAYVLSGLLCAISLSQAQDQYAGSQTCAKCHRDISVAQSKTAMANTWRGGLAVASSHISSTEQKDNFEVIRSGDKFKISVAMPAGARVTLPVDAMVGGGRHGVSFLARAQAVDGIALERPALIEARYALSPHGDLVLSSGFSPDKPAVYEDAVGRVLSPGFEQRCLTCHGQPHTLGAGEEGGVRCETCHGPSASHALKLAQQASLHGPDSMEVCAQCHTGLNSATHSDLLPDDLLVSSQVPALRNSECYIQSGGNVGCTNCHNPHNDSAGVAEATVKTCLSCHSSERRGHAGLCPVNRTRDCIGCHMPSVEKAEFHLVDHWIRVHPEQGIKAEQQDDALRSKVAPKREFLRIIVVNEGAQAAVKQRLAKGDSFSAVAHDLSADPTAPGGGFIGEMALTDMDSTLAAEAARLPYGGTSGVIQQNGRVIVLHRLDRDFKYEANRLFEQAVALKKQGDLKGALKKNQQALDIYPYFLRALIFMGTSIGEAGDSKRASEILSFAVQFYPKDSTAQFNLALTLKQPAQQIAALRRAIELDPDLVAAYQSLGAALYSSGQPQTAIDVFHQGLRIDPLSAVLYYDLGLALKEQGDATGSERALILAAKLDPQIAARHH